MGRRSLGESLWFPRLAVGLEPSLTGMLRVAWQVALGASCGWWHLGQVWWPLAGHRSGCGQRGPCTGHVGTEGPQPLQRPRGAALLPQRPPVSPPAASQATLLPPPCPFTPKCSRLPP